MKPTLFRNQSAQENPDANETLDLIRRAEDLNEPLSSTEIIPEKSTSGSRSRKTLKRDRYDTTWELMRTNPVESIATLCGIIIVAFGLALSQEADWVSFAGAIIGVIGTLLAAVAGSWVFGKSSFQQQTNKELLTLRRHLFTASAQITWATDRGLSGEEPPDTTLIRIEQIVNTLSTLITDIEKITHEEEFPEDIRIRTIDLKRIMLDFGKSLTRVREQAKIVADQTPSSDATDAILALQQQTDELQKKLDLSIKFLDKVQPDVRTPHVMVLGEPKTLSLTCPECKNHFSASFYTGQTDQMFRWCINCGAKLVIDPDSDDVKMAFPRRIFEGKYVPDTGIICSVCGLQHRAFKRNDSKIFAMCKAADALVSAQIPGIASDENLPLAKYRS